ncbi:MAG TPA: trypsin-like serine protease [Dehalococcoidia bacterium]|nr:trypsin-like serine protease [Dehalococcoidia bacterium]
MKKTTTSSLKKPLKASPGFHAHLNLGFRLMLLLVLVALLLPGCGPKAGLTASATNGQAPFTVSFTNTSKGADEFHWDFGDGSTMTTTTIEESVDHEYTLAGTHTVTLTVSSKESPDKSNTSTVTITVEPGPFARAKPIPEIAELDIGESMTFTAEAVDAYDNPIAGAEFDWEAVDEVGTITDDGTLTAGTTAGTFVDAVVVTAELDGTTFEAEASVVINPDPLEAVSITTAQVGAGESQQLVANAVDQYGNLVNDVSLAWTTLDTNAGSVSSDGLFNAEAVLGDYPDAVEVEATQGVVTCTATGQVTIIPGPLAGVYIAPHKADIGIEMPQQFVAVGTDQYGNRIPGLDFTWSVDEEAGTIDQTGLLTAGLTPGDYTNTVMVEATQDGETYSATADVIIEPDRIAFLSDQNDDQLDIYIMEVDGSNQERLTTDGVKLGNYAFSPCGNRIVFNLDSDNICTVNVDGTWLIPILSGRDAFEPAWSPDGTKIVFQSWEHDPSEIYVMDVDGGNLVRLTDNSDYDDYPAWSPDGTKIAFVSDRDGNNEIYVMDADGSNQRRLTNHSAWDTFPAWSPDGNEILFQSSRGGTKWGIYIMNADGTDVRSLTPASYSSNHPSWSPDGTKVLFHSFKDSDEGEIYIMDRDGSNMVRLTTNSAGDYAPAWAPRRAGAWVTEDSIEVAAATNLGTMTAQEVTAMAREAVVRIETDLASGSGFLISADGLILTNNHMVSDAEEITVYLEDGTSYEATVEARDLVRDLALIRIDADELPYLEIGDPMEVDLGQQVMVLGYPLAGDNITVTSGLVSAIDFDCGRNITWLQTDSAINPGNSGGPMLNMQGQVVGVVSAKLVGIAVEGIGFAISVNTVNMYLPRLMDGEVITSY